MNMRPFVHAFFHKRLKSSRKMCRIGSERLDARPFSCHFSLGRRYERRISETLRGASLREPSHRNALGAGWGVFLSGHPRGSTTTTSAFPCTPITGACPVVDQRSINHADLLVATRIVRTRIQRVARGGSAGLRFALQYAGVPVGAHTLRPGTGNGRAQERCGVQRLLLPRSGIDRVPGG